MGPISLLGRPASFDGGLHELAPGVHAWLQPNGEWGESNAALIAGAGEAMLVDTLWTPALTRAMLDEAAERVAVPIRWLVNTHSDGDHVWGNQLLAEAEIIATRTAAEIIVAEPPEAIGRMRALAPWLARMPGVSNLGRYLGWMLGPYDFSDVRVTPPSRGFDGRLALEVAGRAVELEAVGPAHTPGDLIVHVPDCRIVVAGDVVFAGVHPVMWAGPTASWIAALERILALDPVVVVPGHGPLCGPPEVRVLRDYLEWVQSSALPRLAAGASPHEVAGELARSAEFSRAPWAAWPGAERMVITIATVERHRRGERRAVGALERARLFHRVAELARELGVGPFAPLGQMPGEPERRPALVEVRPQTSDAVAPPSTR